MSNIRATPVNPSLPLTWAPEPVGTPAAGERTGARRDGTDSSIPRQQVLSDLLRWEGDTHFLYRDQPGFVTVGVGNLLRSAEDAERLPFVDTRTGAPATREQIHAAFQEISQEAPGRKAATYAPATHIRLLEQTVRSLAAERLNHEFLPGLRRLFPNFERFPPQAQRALIDMTYNLGLEGLGRFHNLRAACASGDWSTAAAACHRRTCRAERNDWTRTLFLDAANSSSPVS